MNSMRSLARVLAAASQREGFDLREGALEPRGAGSQERAPHSGAVVARAQWPAALRAQELVRRAALQEADCHPVPGRAPLQALVLLPAVEALGIAWFEPHPRYYSEAKGRLWDRSVRLRRAQLSMERPSWSQFRWPPA